MHFIDPIPLLLDDIEMDRNKVRDKDKEKVALKETETMRNKKED